MPSENQLEKSDKFKWFDATLISVAHFIHDIYTSFLAPLQTVIMDAFSLNHSMFGLLSVFQRIPTLLNPFIGILADKVRIRYLMIFSPLVTALCMSLIGQAQSFIGLSILVFISGISSSMFHVPTPVMIKHISGNKTGKGMSFYMVGGEFARTIGPLIILGAVDLWAFEGTFRLIPGGLVASFILFIRFRKTDLRKSVKDRYSGKLYWDEVQKHWNLLLIIALIILFRGGIKSILTYYLMGFMEELGMSRWLSGIALSVVYLSGTLGVLASGTISDYFGKRKTLLIASVLSPIFVFSFMQFHSIAGFIFLALAGFVLLSPTPVFLSIVNSLKSHHLPFLNGIFMTSNFLASALSTMLTGVTIDLWGYNSAMYLMLAVSALVIPLIFMMKLK